VNGVLKEQLGFKRFRLRGLEKVKGELALLCCAYNLKKLHRLRNGSTITQALRVRVTALQPLLVDAISVILVFLCGFRGAKVGYLRTIFATFFIRR